MILSLILGAATGAAIPTGGANELLVDTMAPSHAGEPILHPFVGFSIEFAWFPAFAGTLPLKLDEIHTN